MRKPLTYSLLLHMFLFLGEYIYAKIISNANMNIENADASLRSKRQKRELFDIKFEPEDDAFGVTWKIKRPKKEIQKQSKKESAKVDWDQEPALLTNKAPEYPEMARKLGLEGVTTLVVQIDKNGNPIIVQIYKSSGHQIFDQAAKQSVKSWSFSPAKLAGISVKSTVMIPIRFRLNKKS